MFPAVRSFTNEAAGEIAFKGKPSKPSPPCLAQHPGPSANLEGEGGGIISHSWDYIVEYVCIQTSLFWVNKTDSANFLKWEQWRGAPSPRSKPSTSTGSRTGQRQRCFGHLALGHHVFFCVSIFLLYIFFGFWLATEGTGRHRETTKRKKAKKKDAETGRKKEAKKDRQKDNHTERLE